MRTSIRTTSRIRVRFVVSCWMFYFCFFSDSWAWSPNTNTRIGSSCRRILSNLADPIHYPTETLTRRKASLSASSSPDKNDDDIKSEKDTSDGRPPQTSNPADPSSTTSSSSSPSSSLQQQQQQQQQQHKLDSTSIRAGPEKQQQPQQQQPQQPATAMKKRIRLAKAQAEIDRILSGPDAPFDPDTELQRVTSLHPPQPSLVLQQSLSESPQEEKKENLQEHLEEELLLRQEEAVCHDLEAALYHSVQAQDYATAARQRQALNEQHRDDSLSVLQVNAAFYRAFSQKDYPLMQSLWLPDESIACIHPSHPPLIGAHAVGNAWKRMFAQNSNTKTGGNHNSFQRSWVEPANIHVSVRGSATAIVWCDEHVYARRFRRGQRRQTVRVNTLTATNIFRRVQGRWYLTHHHASWHAQSAIAQRALQLASSTSTSSSTKASTTPHATRSSPTWSLTETRNRIRRGRHRPNNNDNQNNSDDPDDISMDGMLGIPNLGADLGGAGGGDDSDGSSSTGKRKIIVGNLSDILNGNLADLLGPGGAGKGENDAIIRIRKIESLGDSDDDDDDEDDDDDSLDLVLDEEDDEEDDDDDEMEDEDDDNTVSIIKEWAESSSKKTRHNGQNDSTTESEAHVASSNQNHPPPPSSSRNRQQQSSSSSIRQQCISSLRQLCRRGSISPRQKRVLLTDIIACSARGETSLVEVAYELLVAELVVDENDTNTNDVIMNEDVQEEFADQCRVLAESMPDSHVTNHRSLM